MSNASPSTSEFFVAAKQAGISGMQAAPVELRERLAGSSVGVKAILRTIGEALSVFGRLHRPGPTAAKPQRSPRCRSPSPST